MKRAFPLAVLVTVLLAAAFPLQATAAEPPSEGGSAVAAEICHWNGSTYEPIADVASSGATLDEHRAHGDRFPGESIPVKAGPGKYLEADCGAVSWLLGTTLGGCVTEVPSAAPCDPSVVGSAEAGGLFSSGEGTVVHPGAEFASEDGAVQADFTGDYLTLTVAPDQPALRFVFNFGDWQLWNYYVAGLSTLPLTATEGGSRQLAIETASTEGATEPQSIIFRVALEHSAGISPFRNTTIEVANETLPADEESTTTVTVQLRDVLGEIPSEERFVQLFMNQQFGTIGPVEYQGDGVYTATITAGAAPGTAKIVAMVDYLDLDLSYGTLTLTQVRERGRWDD